MASTSYSKTDISDRDGAGQFVIDSAVVPVTHWMTTGFVTDATGIETTEYAFFDQPGPAGVTTVPTGVVRPYKDLEAVVMTAAQGEVTTDGTVAAGATSVTIANVGTAVATVAGGPLRVGSTVSFSVNRPNESLAAIAYTATGTTLKLIEVRA